MPRLYTSANDPVDFCKSCWGKDEKWMRCEYNTEGEEGPDERGDCWEFNADHPDYHGEDYSCESCGQRLSGKDD